MQLYETMVNNQGVHIHVTEVHRDLRNEQTHWSSSRDCPSQPRITSPLWKSCPQAYCYHHASRPGPK